MRDLDLGGLRHVLLAVAAVVAALAVLVWAVATWWLPALLIVTGGTALVLLLKHGDRLAVAWWPSRHQAQARDAARPVISAAPPETEQDPWL